jgi:methyl-accepting chemotaxis protein
MKSLLAVPLLFGDKSLGNLYVTEKTTAGKVFSEDDEQVIKVFAQIAANVITEKYFREELEQRKKTLENEVTKLTGVISRLSEGDLLVEVEQSTNKDEISYLRSQLAMMASNLSNLLRKVKEAIDATASASNEISASTEEMSAGAKEQTIQASEVAGAVEEMAKTIIETSSNTSVAAETAKQAGENAKEGGKVVIQTITGMNKIAEVVMQLAQTVEALGKSSDQIGEIVQVIDDIADQTNLLALNAAIEAARAGEQGRGFAVVADEVRKLAERTTKATKEIADMIKKIQKDTIEAVQSMKQGTSEVEAGKELANKAGIALEQIISGTQKVSDIIRQVAAASEQQSKASENISKNIEAITTVTHESAAGAHQIARAAEDLSRLTVNLQDMVGRFRT